ncbi:MAG: hypothetical protein ORN85_08515, partial [Sediminibacterium sp.]|nr:hypothetical protein [Sediminibacterium sp.]
MNLSQIEQIYYHSLIIKKIQNYWKENPQKSIFIPNLNGDLKAFIATAIWKNLTEPLNQIFILHSEEDAKYLFNTFENLLSERSVFYFPAEFKNIKKKEFKEKTHLQFRHHLLQHLHSNSSKIIITYTESWLEKIELWAD